MKLYYYYHPESDSLWSSPNPPGIELNVHPDVDNISEDTANQLADELGLDEIPYEEL